MPSLQAGQRAPEFELSQLDGGLVNLSDLLEYNKSVLLVFLRHLG